MNNYLQIGNTRVELTDEQVNQILNGTSKFEKEENSKNVLADIEVSKTFNIGKYEFIVLEQFENKTLVILKNSLCENKEFGKNNNYNGSYVDEMCNVFADEISEIIGAENIVEHTVDLTTDDGLKDYGSITRKMSLLTAELYRRYVEILDKHKIDKYWWLATAYSTPTHEEDEWVKCVSLRGNVHDDGCNVNNIGVRPFCILKSNIFVSK